MTKEEYRELLKDGRWQRKRLEIMQRDDFKCRECGTTNDLNVHHIRYIDGRMPWEYDNGDLVTLCGKCHKELHEEIERKRKDADKFCERAFRAEHLSDLLLYYKQIGKYYDVITQYKFWDIEELGNIYFTVDFFYHNVMPNSETWMFSENAGNIIYDKEEVQAIREYVWEHEPNDILSVEQFENVRKGLETDKEYLCFWLQHVIEHDFKAAEERYQKPIYR